MFRSIDFNLQTTSITFCGSYRNIDETLNILIVSGKKGYDDSELLVVSSEGIILRTPRKECVVPSFVKTSSAVDTQEVKLRL